MSLRSPGPLIGVHLGTGMITAVRHADGTTLRCMCLYASMYSTFSLKVCNRIAKLLKVKQR